MSLSDNRQWLQGLPEDFDRMFDLLNSVDMDSVRIMAMKGILALVAEAVVRLVAEVFEDE